MGEKKSCAPTHLVCLGETADSTEGERIVIILNVAEACICSVASTTSASIDDRLERELETSRRNDEEERQRERIT